MVINRQNLLLAFIYLTVFALSLLTIKNAFFWDTIQLGSKHANFYFTTDFSSVLLPDSIDSGHIPAFGMYLALIWKIFGRTLIISHLAMFPFILGILWQLQKLISKFVNKKYVGWALLLVVLDPTLLSQLTLISPDVSLVFFFLLGLNSILENRKKILSLAIVFLFLTSMRGMMVSFCLFIFDAIININYSKSIKDSITSLLKRSMVYLPALIIFISFSILHYAKKGWIGFHENSPWATLFENVGFKGFLVNIGILGWRLVDFGRIGIWLVFFIILARYKSKIFTQGKNHLLVQIFLIFLIILPLNMLWATNLLGHRYLIPVYLTFSFLCASMLFSQQIDKKLRVALVSLWLVSVVGGNFWVYPEKISQGWDSTLAHLPYYKIRQQAIEYIDEQRIDFSSVQSFFPNVAIVDDVDLNNDYRQFIEFDNSCSYVLYSNVFNISDEDYDFLRNHYSVIKQFKSGLVYFDICKKTY